MKRNHPAKLLSLLLAVILLLGALPLSASAAAPEAGAIFTFSDSSISASGSEEGYSIQGTALSIESAGVYAVTGSCQEGSIKVKKGVTGVTLVLEDLSLASSTTAPIVCAKSSETILYISGQVTLTDKEEASTQDSNEDFEGACIKVKSGASLTLTGSGTLTADASACKNGIKGAATAVITVAGSLTLNITAPNNGLASDGELVISGGTVNVAAGNDGIKSEPDEDDSESKGSVTITGGTIAVNAQGDGIQATNFVDISGGAFTITTYGGYQNNAALEANDLSAKGIKASGDEAGLVQISGGSFTFNCADDAIHSDGCVSVTGGTFSIRTGDDAIHADYDLVLGSASSGPEVTVTSCVEGLEGTTVTLNGGSGSITATDDGVNAASDLSGAQMAIVVNGGTWLINAAGDGLDAGGNSQNNSGGDIWLNGGTVEAVCTGNGNGALDFDGRCYANGGTLLAVGSDMAQTPTAGVSAAFGAAGGMNNGQPGMPGIHNNTTQPGMPGNNGNNSGQPGPGGRSRGEESQEASGLGPMNQNGSASISGKITITDESGSVLYTSSQNMSGSYAIFCSPGLVSGSSYTLTSSSGSVTAQASGDSSKIPQDSAPSLPDDEPNQPSQTLSGTPFIDVTENAWYASAVAWVTAQKVMNGVSDTSFAPQQNLTRAMMAQILYNIEGRPAVDGETAFDDVNASAWYAKAVDWAQENGVVSGYGDGSFGPDDPITRAQAAVFLANYAACKGENTQSAGEAASFSDSGDIPDWAAEAMNWCVAGKILEGSGGALSPNATATRAQIAAIMQRYLTK